MVFPQWEGMQILTNKRVSLTCFVKDLSDCFYGADSSDFQCPCKSSARFFLWTDTIRNACVTVSRYYVWMGSCYPFPRISKEIFFCRAKTAVIVKNMIALTHGASIGDLTSLEELVSTTVLLTTTAVLPLISSLVLRLISVSLKLSLRFWWHH
jgi:hypothetical protein